jgi:glycerophosphoryl diester phosphodiesterase
MLSLREIASKKNIFIAAHRGSSGTAPENTLAAYRDAVDAGADLVETDVQFTADGYAVAFHDKNLSRTTDGSGLAREITLDKINKLDAGAWFDEKFRGEHIPLLTDVIRLIKGKCYLNIEVKNIEGDDMDSRLDKIISIIRSENYENYTLFSSFYYNTLLKIKQTYPTFPTAAIRIPRDTRLPSQIIDEVHCDAFICSLEEMTADVAEDISTNRIYTAIYLVDTEEELKTALTMPVKALVTNYPARIKSLLDELGIK